MCAQKLTLAFATIGWVSMVTRHASLALGTSCEVTALFAHAAVHTRAVSITLACCKRGHVQLTYTLTLYSFLIVTVFIPTLTLVSPGQSYH